MHESKGNEQEYRTNILGTRAIDALEIWTTGFLTCDMSLPCICTTPHRHEKNAKSDDGNSSPYTSAENIRVEQVTREVCSRRSSGVEENNVEGSSSDIEVRQIYIIEYVW